MAHLTGNCREAVDRVLASETFRGSSSLRTLLGYLTDKTLAGDAEELKEFTVGVEALDRSEQYDPQIDPSVRVQISRLRRKLAKYYEQECPGDPVRISLPKRQFKLVFEERAVAINDARAQSHAPSASQAQTPWRRGVVLAVAAGAVLAAFAIGATLPRIQPASLQLSETGVFTPAMRQFWQPYFDSQLPATLSLGVALFMRVPGDPVTYMRQTRVNEWPPEEEVPGLAALQAAIGDGAPAHEIYNYCSVGEAIGAAVLGRSLLTGGLDLPIVRSNAISWDEAQSGNIVFVGPPKFNSLIRTGAFERNFRVVEGGIENLEPLPGEPEFYGKVEEPTGRPGMAHALISRFPNKRAGVVTVLASNDGTGTWGAAEYVTQPEFIAGLVEKLAGPDGAMPDAFEVVVRVRCDLDYPLDITYVTHRSY